MSGSGVPCGKGSDRSAVALALEQLYFGQNARTAFAVGQARGADALYILGDLFESWVGDDAADAGQSAAIAEIKSLTASGVPCFVMHGNRDFLLGPQFCEAAGAQLLPDPLIMTLYGEPVLLMHGDALCTDDNAYQRLRATVRVPV